MPSINLGWKMEYGAETWKIEFRSKGGDAKVHWQIYIYIYTHIVPRI